MIKEIKQFNLNFGTFQIKPPFIWHIWHIFKIWNKPSSMFQRRLLPPFFFTKFKTIPIQISFISFWKLHELSFQATINRIKFFTIYFIQKGYTYILRPRTLVLLKSGRGVNFCTWNAMNMTYARIIFQTATIVGLLKQ